MKKGGVVARNIIFSLIIATSNSLGYLISVGIPIFLDPMIRHHVLYGPRTYDHSGAIMLLSIIIFLFTFVLTISNLQSQIKSVLNFIILVGIVWSLLPIFKPEYPHAAVFLIPLTFGIITSASIYIHYYKIDSSILESSKDNTIKIEKIKLEYETWFRFFLVILTGYVAVYISFGSGLKNLSSLITYDGGEQFLIQAIYIMAASINAIVFAICICLEFVKKINEIKNKMDEI